MAEKVGEANAGEVLKSLGQKEKSLRGVGHFLVQNLFHGAGKALSLT